MPCYRCTAWQYNRYYREFPSDSKSAFRFFVWQTVCKLQPFEQIQVIPANENSSFRSRELRVNPVTRQRDCVIACSHWQYGWDINSRLTFSMNNAARRYRAVDPQGSCATRPKGKGKGIMISDFLEEYGGFLSLTDKELQCARQLDPNFPRAARETFIFGENYDGYWTCELLLANLQKAVAIAMFKYPR